MNDLDVVTSTLLDIIDLDEVYQAINDLKEELDQLGNSRKQEQVLKSFVHYAPVAIAMVDREMRYLAISDRWIKDLQLENKNIIGYSHEEIFPKILPHWRQDYQDCLTGKVDFIEREEESVVYFNGKVDWLYWELRPWYDLEGNIGGLLMRCEVITERRLLEQQLLSSEFQMRNMFAAMTDLILTIDLTTESIQVLPTKFLNSGCSHTHYQIIEQTQSLLFDSLETNNYQAIIKETLATKKATEFEYNLRLNNQLVWFSVNVSPLSDTIAVWAARNITQRKQIEQNLFAEKELAQVTLKSIGDAVITTDANSVVQYINPVAEVLTGINQSEACGRGLSEVFQIINEHTRESITDKIEMVLPPDSTVGLEEDVILVSRDGTEYAIEDSATPIKNREGNFVGAVIVFRDVTQSRNLTRKLSWQANHDALTGLYNRRKFKERVSLAINDARNQGNEHVICYLDLDRFKAVNDSCGHAAGDKLLKQLSNLIEEKIRSSDVLARLGGDEFGLLLHKCSLEVGHTIANHIVQMINDFNFVWESQTLKVGVSIGIVSLNSQTQNLDSLLNRVDSACYAAKSQGRNRVHLLC